MIIFAASNAMLSIVLFSAIFLFGALIALKFAWPMLIVASVVTVTCLLLTSQPWLCLALSLLVLQSGYLCGALIIQRSKQQDVG